MLIGRARRERKFLELWRDRRAELLASAGQDLDTSVMTDEEIDDLVVEVVEDAWKRRKELARQDTSVTTPAPPVTDEEISDEILGVAHSAIDDVFARERRRDWRNLGVIGGVIVVVVAAVIITRPSEGGAPSSLVECRGLVPSEDEDSNESLLVPLQVPVEITERGPIATCEALWRTGGEFAPEGEVVDVPPLWLCDNGGTPIVIVGESGTACVTEGLSPAVDQDPPIVGVRNLARAISDETASRCLQLDEFAQIVEDILDENNVDDWAVVTTERDAGDDDGPPTVGTVHLEVEWCARADVNEEDKVITAKMLPGDF